MSLTLDTVYPCAPLTKRGYGYHLSINKNEWLVYCNNQSVILRNLKDPSAARVFSEHKHIVNVARWSPSGRMVASGDAGGTVIIWEVLDDKFHVRCSYEINKCINDLDWSPDNKRLLVAGDGAEKKCAAIMVDTGNSIGEVKGHQGRVLSCSFKPSRPFRAVTSGEDQLVCFHSGPPFKFELTNRDHSNYVNAVRYSPNGDQFVSVSSDKHIITYDGKTGEKMLDFGFDAKTGGGHSGSIYNVSWTPDSKQILTVAADKTAKLWTAETGELVRTYDLIANVSDKSLHTGKMQLGCAVSENFTLTLGFDGVLNILDADNPNQPSESLPGLVGNIKASVLDKVGGRVFVADDTGNFVSWDLKTHVASLVSGKGHGKPVIAATMSADGKSIVTTSADASVIVSDVSGSEGLAFGGEKVSVGGEIRAGIANAPTDSTLHALVNHKQELVIIKDGKVASITAMSKEGRCLCFSSDDTVWVGGDKKGAVVSYKLSNGGTEVKEGPVTMTESEDRVEQLTSNGNGLVVAINGWKEILFFNPDEGKVLNKNLWKVHTGGVTSCAFSPDGSKFATASMDESVLVFEDLETFKSTRQKAKGISPLGATYVDWLDNDTIVVVGKDKCVRTLKLNK